MNTTSLQIVLSPLLKAFVENEVQSCGYADPSEYICALIEEDRQRKGKEEFEAILMAGFTEGDPQAYRERRLQDLRQKIDLGLQQLERGEWSSGEEVFRRLEERLLEQERSLP